MFLVCNGLRHCQSTLQQNVLFVCTRFDEKEYINWYNWGVQNHSFMCLEEKNSIFNLVGAFSWLWLRSGNCFKTLSIDYETGSKRGKITERQRRYNLKGRVCHQSRKSFKYSNYSFLSNGGNRVRLRLVDDTNVPNKVRLTWLNLAIVDNSHPSMYFSLRWL